MLTRLVVRNFKRFQEVDLELGSNVVLVGPNNSGKTTALQALALWHVGVQRWHERRRGKQGPEKRPGVTINRRDLIAIPVPSANLLWRDLHVREIERANGSQRTQNVRIEVVVEGIDTQPWTCGLEFDYANEESFYCRPLRQSDGERLPVPQEAAQVHVAFLPPMSGLAAVEPKWEPGRINVLIGEGQTAQVLRNLCYRLCYPDLERGPSAQWQEFVERIRQLFGVALLPPQYLAERGEITMLYREGRGRELDLASSGRGLQQTMLLLAYMYANPSSVLLLDEPDAHLEVLRQRQTYQLITEIAREQRCQLIIATHSEVVLNEAAGQDIVIAFVGKPHRIDGRSQRDQVRKALTSIGFEQYQLAEQCGWVLYLEGSTDLDILRALAVKLNHPAARYLERPFVKYVSTNLPQIARDHFFGLREAKPDLIGIAIFDRLDKPLRSGDALRELMWRKREIENYLCQEATLLRFARGPAPHDLFASQREQAMRDAIAEVSAALKTLNKPSPWSDEIKASDEFLAPLFTAYYQKLGRPSIMGKQRFHELVDFIEPEDVDAEICEKLNAIVEVARQAKPL
jgi:predicted ATPase